MDQLIERLRTASRVTVLTGAGVSAASGVPTFRGAGGLWKHFRVEQLATPEAFARDPVTVWEWYDWPTLPPTCPHCGGLARPDVVWFGEPIPSDAIRNASHAAATCEVFIAAGTSSIVYPAAGLLHEAAHHGAFTAEINVKATEASPSVNLAIQAPAEILLREIDALLAV